MKTTKKLLALTAAFTMLVITTGCSQLTSANNETAGTMVVNYNIDSLRNYKTARDLSAAGRYELAKEHYLLALASANNPDLQDALVAELESIDLMIKSLR